MILTLPEIDCRKMGFLGAQKLTRSGVNGVSERDFWKTNLSFSRLIQVLYLRGKNCLENARSYNKKGPCWKTPLNWTGSVFPLLRTFPAEKCISCRKMGFPAEKCSFLQKIYVFLPRHAYFPAEKCGFGGAHRKKPQETAGGFQGSRIKNASQLAQA